MAASILASATQDGQVEAEIKAAKFLTTFLFKHEVDKAGKPYTGHLYRVAQGVPKKLKAAAYMHDLVEDIDGWDFDDLKDIGFSDYTIDAVRAVTKKAEGEKYFEAMERVGKTPHAIPVKRSDLRDNANLLRLTKGPGLKDFNRVTKYFLADKYLEDIELGQIKPGTKFREWLATKPQSFQFDEIVNKETAAPKPRVA